MKKSLMFVATVATLTIVAPVYSSAMQNSVASTAPTKAVFHPITDADILALRGAPGTAVLVSARAPDRTTDADLLALGLSVGNSRYKEPASFDPIIDADIVALRLFDGRME